jgi:8-oxo-dGTP pyrophosphatase MutT (NUDIX family)
MSDIIRRVDVNKIEYSDYKKQLADCVIVTHDHKLFLQTRPSYDGTNAQTISLFGGHIEKDESAKDAVIREINEETGGIIKRSELLFLCALTEDWTNHTELVHVFFWYDRAKTITGCYEHNPISFSSVPEILSDPKVMPYAKYSFELCDKNQILKPFKIEE